MLLKLNSFSAMRCILVCYCLQFMYFYWLVILNLLFIFHCFLLCSRHQHIPINQLFVTTKGSICLHCTALLND